MFRRTHPQTIENSELSLDQLEAASGSGTANSGDYKNLCQTLSNCLRMMADLQKAITGNIR